MCGQRNNIKDCANTYVWLCVHYEEPETFIQTHYVNLQFTLFIFYLLRLLIVSLYICLVLDVQSLMINTSLYFVNLCWNTPWKGESEWEDSGCVWKSYKMRVRVCVPACPSEKDRVFVCLVALNTRKLSDTKKCKIFSVSEEPLPILVLLILASLHLMPINTNRLNLSLSNTW